MRVLVLEAHHLVFYGGAVAWPFAVNPASILGGLMQVGLNHGVRGCSGMGQMARHLLPLNMYLVADTQSNMYLVANRQSNMYLVANTQSIRL